MNNFAPPLTLNEIRRRAKKIRNLYPLTPKQRFPIKHFFALLDRGYEEAYDERFLLVGFKEEMGHSLGYTYLEKPQIMLREDIYCEFDDDTDEGRFTGAHEYGHADLHPGSPMSRLALDVEVPPLFCPEKQADIFACELLLNIAYVKRYHSSRTAHELSLIYGLPEYAVLEHLDRMVDNGDIPHYQLSLAL